MTVKKSIPAPRTNRKAAAHSPVQSPSAYHRLDALLHTMRCIAQYEDALCELSHEVKRTGALAPEVTDKLHDILEKIPSDDFVLDLDAVKAAVGTPPPPSKADTKKAASKKVARSVPPRRKPVAAKKKSGRKSSR
jgi:hypothetical protein